MTKLPCARRVQSNQLRAGSPDLRIVASLRLPMRRSAQWHDAELLPADSGGTVMDLHHLPRPPRRFYKTPFHIKNDRPPSHMPVTAGDMTVRNCILLNPSNRHRDARTPAVWMCINNDVATIHRAQAFRRDRLHRRTDLDNPPIL
jgi:hypothetical protein